MAQVHKCGKCGAEFATEKDYCGHTCKTTGFKPVDPRHNMTKEELAILAEKEKEAEKK